MATKKYAGTTAIQEVITKTKALLADLLAKQNSQGTYITLYGVSKTGNTQTMYNAAESVVAEAIPIRNANGHIYVPQTPLLNTQAASKGYVDTQVSGKANTSDLGTQCTFSLSGTTLTITPK